MTRGTLLRMASESNGMITYRLVTPNGAKDVTREEFEAAGGFNAMPPPIAESPSRPTPNPFEAGIAEGRRAALEDAQTLFAEYAESIRKPHAGDAYKTIVQGILKQAEERGLYTPPPETT